MRKLILLNVMKDTILHDAMQWDTTTARRVALLEILLNERYLTRSQLIAGIELRLGKNYFEISAWEDTFFHHMRFVKQALKLRAIDCYTAETSNNLATTRKGPIPHRLPIVNSVVSLPRGCDLEPDPC
jgi:hypothetical protein